MAEIKTAIDWLKHTFNLDHVITLDYETYYGQGHSLSGKTYAQYIMGEKYKTHMLGICVDDGTIEVLCGADLDDKLETIKMFQAKGRRIGLICQNTCFDGAILNWRHGMTFDMYFDTQLCSKLCFINHSSSLKNQVTRIFPDDESLRKGAELESSKGVWDLHEAGIYDSIADYCKQDVNLTRRLIAFYVNSGRVPMLEWQMMHITLRGAIEPQFEINIPLLQTVVVDETQAKLAVVATAQAFLAEYHPDLTVSREIVSSNNKYIALLKSLGVKIPLKLSKTTFLMAPALGKNDPEYIKVQMDHPKLMPIFDARRVIKSSIAESRAKRLIESTQLISDRNQLPMFLNYHAAHTGRWSGGQKLNQQNLQRGSKHRLSLMAKGDDMIVVRDLSGIELRMNLWFCEQDDLLEQVDRDLYSVTASGIYGFDVDKKKNPTERQVGKVAELGLGYGMGAYTFQQTLAGGPMGMAPMFVDDAFAQNVKDTYNLSHMMIVAMWKFLNNVVIPAMAHPNNEGQGCVVKIGRHEIVEVHYRKLVLPSGRELQYDGLHMHSIEHSRGYDTQYRYDDGKRDRFKKVVWKKLYGGLLLENIIQAISRDVIAYHIGLTEDYLHQTGLGWVIGSVHDEILASVRAEHADAVYDEMGVIMATPPSWCPDVPLASEGGVAKEYSK